MTKKKKTKNRIGPTFFRNEVCLLISFWYRSHAKLPVSFEVINFFEVSRKADIQQKARSFYLPNYSFQMLGFYLFFDIKIKKKNANTGENGMLFCIFLARTSMVCLVHNELRRYVIFFLAVILLNS